MDLLQAFVVVLTLLTFLARWHYVMASIKAQRLEVHLLQLYEDVRSRRTPSVMNGDGDLPANACRAQPSYKRDPDIFVDNEDIGQQPRVAET